MKLRSKTRIDLIILTSIVYNNYFIGVKIAKIVAIKIFKSIPNVYNNTNTYSIYYLI